jgi:hypothetical protein
MGAAGQHGAHHIAALFGRPTTSGASPVQPATTAATADTAAPGVWEHTFGEASTPVGELGRVQAPKGVYLRERPLPGAPSPSAPVPFNGLVFVERRTNQGTANERWCYVIATERYLAIDPPEPTATLHRTAPGERLATIAEQAYGAASDDNNSRLYVQALYLANRDRAGVQLEHIDLSFKDRALRGEDERRTLEIYKGAKAIAGDSLWIPSKPFIEQLEAAGAVTGGSTLITEAWDTAKDAVGAVLDVAKYVAGFFVGLLEGAYNAIVDLFKGAVDMVEAVLKVIWNIVTGNPGRVKELASGWVEKMKAVWEHRGEIADETHSAPPKTSSVGLAGHHMARSHMSRLINQRGIKTPSRCTVWHRSRRPIPGPRTQTVSCELRPRSSELRLTMVSRFPQIFRSSQCKANGYRLIAMLNIWVETSCRANA